MKNLFALVMVLASASWGAFGAATRFSIDAAATAGNVNGISFDPWGANGKADYAVSSANTASPVVSSASYTFVAGDTAYWFMVQAGTSAYSGLSCKIASVSAGAATLNAAIGACDTTTAGYPGINTVVGIGSASSLTSMTGLIDQSRAKAAAVTNTDLGCVGTTCTVTAGITAAMVSNGIHITTTGTGAHFVVGWYKIISQSAATTFVIDRDPTTGGAGVAGTYYIGGAASLGSSDDAIFELAASLGADRASPQFWVKAGTYTIGGAINIAAQGYYLNPIRLWSYNTVHGDNPYPSTPVTFSLGSNAWIISGYDWNPQGISFTGTAAYMVSDAAGSTWYGNKFTSLNTTSSSAAFRENGGSVGIIGNVFTCYRCNGARVAEYGTDAVINNVFRNSNIGLYTFSGTVRADIGNIFYGNKTGAYSTNGLSNNYNAEYGNTYIGWVTPMGYGYYIPSGRNQVMMNNSYYGFVTAILNDADNSNQIVSYNNFYNNTTNLSKTYWAFNNTTTNPAFLNITELNVTGGVTITGNKYYKTGAGFVQNDTNNAFYLVSGTSTTNSVLYPISAVSANGDTITSGMTLTANATADHVIRILRVLDPTPGARLVQQQNIPGLGTGVSNFPPVGGINKSVWPWIFK